MIKCIVIDIDKSSRKDMEDIINNVKHLEILKSCSKLSEAAGILSKQPVDILFLDIPHPGKNGLGFLEDLKYDKPKVIILSDTKEVAKEAFDIDAVDFILKPVTVTRVVKAISKAFLIKSEHEKEIIKSNSSIFIKEGKRFLKTNLKDIYMIEALSDYVNIYTRSKRYTVHATMKSMENKLPQSDFIRVHKSFIVRLDRITAIEGTEINVEDKKVPVSNTYKKELLSRLRVI